MTDWNSLRQTIHAASKYAIINTLTGSYILDNLTTVKTFETAKMAQLYIKHKNLNANIYQIVGLA